MHRLPESPRVLVLRGQDEKAREVLQTIYQFATPEVIELKLTIIKNTIAASNDWKKKKATIGQRAKILWTHKPYRRSIFTVSLIQVFGQFTGFNTLLYYAGNLFGLLGLSNPSLGGLIPSITNTFCLVSLQPVSRNVAMEYRDTYTDSVYVSFAVWSWWTRSDVVGSL